MGVVKTVFLNSLLLIFNLVFILTGAGVFTHYEKRGLRRAYRQNIDWNLRIQKEYSEDQIAWLYGNASIKCSNMKTVPWTIGQSINYAISIITTVGWGVMTPSTGVSKAITVIYALIGLPIYGIFVGYFKEFCAKNFKKLVRVPRNWKYYWVLLSVFIVIIIFANIGVNWALEMMKGKLRVALNAPCREINGYEYHQQNKTIWDGLYFGFITVSTIGFGDEYHKLSECKGSSGESVLTALVGFIIFTLLVAMTAHLFDILSDRFSREARFYDSDDSEAPDYESPEVSLKEAYDAYFPGFITIEKYHI